MEKDECLELENVLLENWIRQLESKKIIDDAESGILCEYLSQSKTSSNQLKESKIKKICEKIGIGDNYYLVNNSYNNLIKGVENLCTYSIIAKEESEHFIKELVNKYENIGDFTDMFLNLITLKNKSLLKDEEKFATDNYEEKINDSKQTSKTCKKCNFSIAGLKEFISRHKISNERGGM